jgi:uncharacterized protein (TIGR00725 family)
MRPTVGVMGAAGDTLPAGEKARLEETANKLGAAIAKRRCILITGATTGLPDRVSRAARKHGALAVGISPAASHKEHAERLSLPDDAADVIVCTGFGVKGRNVVNIRSSDIVIIFGGATGTLNEFTIAYDEGKVIGVLEGSGGVADHIREILAICNRTTAAHLLYDTDPEALLDACLAALRSRG